jgi:hypothetical protein
MATLGSKTPKLPSNKTVTGRLFFPTPVFQQQSDVSLIFAKEETATVSTSPPQTAAIMNKLILALALLCGGAQAFSPALHARRATALRATGTGPSLDYNPEVCSDCK